MSNKDLVRYGQKALVSSKSTHGAVGKSLALTGGTGLGLWFVAGLIPFVSLPMLLVAMVVAGIFMWE
jgi:hypothetical protein